MEVGGQAESEKKVRPPASSTPIKLVPDGPASATPGTGNAQKRLTRGHLRSVGASPVSAPAPQMRMTLRRRNSNAIKPVARR